MIKNSYLVKMYDQNYIVFQIETLIKSKMQR